MGSKAEIALFEVGRTLTFLDQAANHIEYLTRCFSTQALCRAEIILSDPCNYQIAGCEYTKGVAQLLSNEVTLSDWEERVQGGLDVIGRAIAVATEQVAAAGAGR